MRANDLKKIKDSFVSYDIAILLKEKGFIECCLSYYNQNGELKWNEPDQGVPTIVKCLESQNAIFGMKGFRTDAPTIGQVQNWLGEKHSIYVLPNVYPTNTTDNKVMWGYDIKLNSDGYFIEIINSLCFYKSYKEAALGGIKHAISDYIK